MFRGNHPAKIDEKGRMKLPSAFKQLLDADNVTEFYITSDDGIKAQIWPLPEWEKIERQYVEISSLDEAAEKYLDLTGYYGQQVEMDNQARVLLPQILRGKAELDGDVMVIGKLNRLEVHNKANFEANLATNGLTAENRRSLAERMKPRVES